MQNGAGNHSFRKNMRKTITMEFFINSKKILFVRYNGTDFSFSQFWQKIPEAEKICYRINEEFKMQFPDLYKEESFHAKDWKEVFLKFINSHLGYKDNILDVFIRSNGEISINLEK